MPAPALPHLSRGCGPNLLPSLHWNPNSPTKQHSTLSIVVPDGSLQLERPY